MNLYRSTLCVLHININGAPGQRGTLGRARSIGQYGAKPEMNNSKIFLENYRLVQIYLSIRFSSNESILNILFNLKFSIFFKAKPKTKLHRLSMKIFANKKSKKIKGEKLRQFRK